MHGNTDIFLLGSVCELFVYTSELQTKDPSIYVPIHEDVFKSDCLLNN